MSSSVSEVDGSLSVGRDCVVGGGLTVRGVSLFSRNVTVKGWLDAPNIKHAYKGLYASEASLVAAYPSPGVGWYALVAPFDAVPVEDASDGTHVLLEDVATVYAVEAGVWVATGLSSSQLDGYLQEMEDNYDTFTSEVQGLVAGLSEQVSSLASSTSSVEESLSSSIKDASTSAAASLATAEVSLQEQISAVSSSVSAALEGYVKTDTVATSSSAGVVQVVEGNGLQVSAGLLSMSAATQAAAGALSSSDKVVLDGLAATGVATSAVSGWMSSTDKTLLSSLQGAIPYFSGLLDAAVGVVSSSTDSVVAVWWVDGVGFVAQGGDGLYYRSWSACGVFSASDYYTCDGCRAYHSDGLLYRYDSVAGGLVLLCEMSSFVRRDEVATTVADGLLSKEDKAALDGMSSLIASGRLSNGTARFDDYCCTKKIKGTLDEATVCHDWDGIIWLSDRKLFAAYKGVAVLSGCGCAEVSFLFYLHWDTECLYMEYPAVDGGLWKDKVYLYAGHLWQWKRCDGQLELSGAAGDYEVLTNEEIDEVLEGFQFVAPVEGALSSVEVSAAYPLVAGATEYDGAGGAVVPLGIVEATDEEIDNIINGE